MTTDEMNTIAANLEKYIEIYYEKVSIDNAQQVIREFDDNWSIIPNYLIDETEKRQSKYGLALVIFSVANYEIDNLTEDKVVRMSNLIDEYERNTNVKYQFGIKEALFFNLGSCWHKLGMLYDNEAIEAFKKYVYYIITQSSNTSYRPTAYAFRKCTPFLYNSLINDRLNLSSPTTFNDPFDCPIIPLMKLSNNVDDIVPLVRKAYLDCLKVACFVSNTKLPYLKNPKDVLSAPVFDEKKHLSDKKEFLNELMWAHYADSHRGICIKYRFCESISQLGNTNVNVVSYFKDVEYSDEALNTYSNKNAINMKDAFFLKGKQWEYENELRFIYFDLNSNSDYGTISIPNCIEAIYFGLNCSKEDKERIISIMKTKKHVTKDLRGTVISEEPIQFYQMELDDEHFGQIKETRITV